MNRLILKSLCLLCLGLPIAQANNLSEVSLRFHTQWDLAEAQKTALKEKYGTIRVSFDSNGQAIPHGLSPELLDRWKRLYELCMRDGCYYCDADEGSCEIGTCGSSNSYCKPHMTSDGRPQCGYQCADYAFISTLL